ncbi:MAG: ATP synthase F1 subunit delta [Acidimicrobiia bacterium]|nr:ATP synthase F1 subunit delta [Acidimicrobiia bacterium]
MSDPVEGYAKAVIDVAQAEGVLDDVEDELFRLARTLEANPDLVQGLSDPGVPATRRQAMIEELLTGKALPQTVSLVSFVVGSGQGRRILEIVARTLDLAAAERNRVVAQVRAATPLDAETKARLATALGRVTGKTVEVRASVDANVIGGVWAKVGDDVIDGTVRHRLERFREGLHRST